MVSGCEACYISEIKLIFKYTHSCMPYISTDDQYRFYWVDLVPDSQLPGSSHKKIDLYHLMLSKILQQILKLYNKHRLLQKQLLVAEG